MSIQVFDVSYIIIVLQVLCSIIVCAVMQYIKAVPKIVILTYNLFAIDYECNSFELLLELSL